MVQDKASLSKTLNSSSIRVLYQTLARDLPAAEEGKTIFCEGIHETSILLLFFF